MKASWAWRPRSRRDDAKVNDHHDLVERMETRHGLRQLSYMKELGMGNDRYHLIDIDHEDKEIKAAEAVEGVVPFHA